ncbi:MAG TPA: adenylate/guanylate cyclase domain-containing protein, partial [Dehalococcoidia bacterium]|nr:adenylate/guanylate cyclase domain-containing protein [Dehalococcoidia bacterium]
GFESGDLKTSIDAVASAVYVDKPDLRRHAAPDGTVTIMFSDIEGSTAMTERLGDKRWMEVLREHNAIVRENVKAHGGFEVKSEGDGFMVAFQSARRALECAIDVQRAFAQRNASFPAHPDPEQSQRVEGPVLSEAEGRAEPAPPAQRASRRAGREVGAATEGDIEPIRVRIGLHAGETIREGEDFFGRNVILAARIAGQAGGGEILVSSVLKALVDSAGDLAWGEPRAVELKGLSGGQEIWPVAWAR